MKATYPDSGADMYSLRDAYVMVDNNFYSQSLGGLL